MSTPEGNPVLGSTPGRYACVVDSSRPALARGVGVDGSDEISSNCRDVSEAGREGVGEMDAGGICRVGGGNCVAG